ncbi:hypothetical protein COCSADRAFT_162018 [Bipolaris sorokiniana ND90Pr]|nr:uncharacterized protein COCSADRAFT_162018 [Bipolaris sorokiniana ND90Pr]EMD62433.1 hypothetical protein COCSADRAFT_162018 [Bipolaris sorokiniana ND90Pr]
MLTTMMKNVEKHCDDRIMLTQRDHVEWTKREEDDAEPLVTTKRAKNGFDGNVDLYLFDYVIQFAGTTTWDPSVHVTDALPDTFARDWSPRVHHHNSGPFIHRNPENAIFTTADLPELMALRPVASVNLTTRSVTPQKADEVALRGYYGDFVGHFDREITLESMYIDEPIFTTKWREAMVMVYRNDPVPMVPKVYALIEPTALGDREPEFPLAL